ncbi:MAG: hypothetical protein LBU99_06820 [Spirochaetaceae bacterium]|jgi:hypothetical protein|nr:hypothetical protein [Spirochaetaceae bacterium]
MDVDTILSDLRNISNTSGTEFLQLSSSFPILIGELDTGGSGASNKIQSLVTLQGKLTKLIEEQMKILTKDRKFLSSFHEKNRNLFSTLTKNLDFLSEMTKIILTIREASMEMEIISLNAMIVSIKSGKEGQAFSYITENLKQLSIKLISQSDNLISFEALIRKNINVLQETVDNVSESWAQLESVIGEDSFNDLFASITEMEIAIQNITAAAAAVKRPILKAMESIQHQDIIRQSLDDVQLTISKIETPPHDAEETEKLDQLTFNVQLSEVAIDVLSNIKKRLDDSITLFCDNQAQVNDILNSVEMKRTEFIKTFLDAGSSKSVSAHISAAISNFEFFMSGVTAYQNSQNRVLSNSMDIQKQAMKIQTCFEEIFPIVTNLQYVAIAQRIEVARTSAINSIHSTVESMSDLITKTHGDVEEAQEQLQSFINNSGSLIQNFSRETASDKNKFTAIMARKSEFLKDLQAIQALFSEELTSFSVYSKDFFSNYQSIGDSIENLKGLSVYLAKTQATINNLRMDMEKTRSSILTSLQLENWEIHNDAFKNFISHFTIVSDKQAAGTVAGLDIEGGVEAGEITLF